MIVSQFSRQDFPLLEKHRRELIYWDNGATTQKPDTVLQAAQDFYSKNNAPVHRASYALGAAASLGYDRARKEVKSFFGTSKDDEVVFTHGCTEAINLVAQQFLAPRIQPGQSVIVSTMEHHANFIPWQRVCQRQGAQLRILPISDQGELILDSLEEWLAQNCAMIAITHVSNVLGTVNPVAKIAALARKNGVPMLIDGAQASGHLAFQLSEIDSDFYCFSTHKMYGLDGAGVLIGKKKHLNNMEPMIVGGGIVNLVTPEKSVFVDSPQRFESGTMPAAAIVTLPAVLGYLKKIDLAKLAEHESLLRQRTLEIFAEDKNITVYGHAKESVGIVSFTIKDVHAHDVATVFDDQGIAIRAGHHCTQILIRRLGETALSRISFGVYNTFEELEKIPSILRKIRRLFL